MDYAALKGAGKKFYAVLLKGRIVAGSRGPEESSLIFAFPFGGLIELIFGIEVVDLWPNYPSNLLFEIMLDLFFSCYMNLSLGGFPFSSSPFIILKQNYPGCSLTLSFSPEVSL